MAKITGILKIDTRFDGNGDPAEMGHLMLHGETATVDERFAHILYPPTPEREPETPEPPTTDEAPTQDSFSDNAVFEDKQAGPTASQPGRKKRGKRAGK